jgi:hypothetical protein
MTLRAIVLLLLAGSLGRSEIVDRVAIIAGNKIIKDSDIDRDLRITAFLNNQRPVFTAAARKA